VKNCEQKQQSRLIIPKQIDQPDSNQQTNDNEQFHPFPPAAEGRSAKLAQFTKFYCTAHPLERCSHPTPNHRSNHRLKSVAVTKSTLKRTGRQSEYTLILPPGAAFL
jgi:hypothetical protein